MAGERVKAKVRDESRMEGQAFEVLNKESSLVTPGYPDRFPMMGVMMGVSSRIVALRWGQPIPMFIETKMVIPSIEVPGYARVSDCS